jgi:mevalonate kinase
LFLHSQIPIASGLGSGAAAATAIACALARWLGWEPSPSELSGIVYETEKILHGTPSGIDNTVIAYERPVWYQRGHPIETFRTGTPLTLLIADTGRSSPTRHTVRDVRRAWEADPASYNSLFDEVAELTRVARAALERGDAAAVGKLMQLNHQLLVRMGVSSEANDHLVAVAMNAGALGAKLSGGGRGGNNVTVVRVQDKERVERALRAAGARRVLTTTLPAGV